MLLKYERENQAKSCFDDVYTAPTPHDYIAMMAKTGYEIGEQARPYCVAAAELLEKHTEDAWPVQMLDIGCSYGMGSAFVKYGCSFDEMVAFFSTRVPRDPQAASQAMRAWINVTPTPLDIRCVGLDSSEPAIRFAMRAGLLDGGIAREFENPDITPNAEECSWLRSCNLLISTGAIGYVTDRTIAHVVRHAGKDHPGSFGPLAVFTILRMFDATTIGDVFEEHGFRFEKVQDIMLPQRGFTDANEQNAILKVLHDRGIDTSEWEDRGKQFAELFVAATPDHFPELLEKMNETHATWVSDKSEMITFVCR
jgi:hypothetical protein